MAHARRGSGRAVGYSVWGRGGDTVSVWRVADDITMDSCPVRSLNHESDCDMRKQQRFFVEKGLGAGLCGHRRFDSDGGCGRRFEILAGPKVLSSTRGLPG